MVPKLVYLGMDDGGGGHGKSVGARLEGGGDDEGVWAVTGSDHFGVE